MSVTVRYLTTIQPLARREIARWRRSAEAIPDHDVRAHVLRPFESDRSVEGAALLAVLAPRRAKRRLVPLLVAYVLLWSYVDVCTERDPDANPRLLDALVTALRTDRPARPSATGDDGYLAELAYACRQGCSALPSWDAVGPVARRHAQDGRAVQAINHGPRTHTERRLRAWATESPDDVGLRWHDRCAAASSPLPVLALLALAADPVATAYDAIAAAYQPISALAVLCDHLLDDIEDETFANHSYLRYCASGNERTQHLRTLAEVARRSVARLPASNRHAVILTAMTAMFLSDEKAWTPLSTATSQEVLDRLGQPTPILMGLLRSRRQRVQSR